MHTFSILQWLLISSLISVLKADLKIEVMKEGLTDLKTTILTSPNVTNFAGSARTPNIGGTGGELVLFIPEDACSPLQSSAYTQKDDAGKLRFSTVSGKNENVVALIARGGCEINEKFLHAKMVPGVVAVLIYNGPNDLMPESNVIVSNQNDDLPGYLISNSLGLELARKIQKYRSDPSSSSAYIEITMTPEMPSAADKANRVVQYALVTIIIILALAFGASIVVHMRTSQFSQYDPSTNAPNARQLPPIDVEFLQKLPLRTYKGRRNSGSSAKSPQQSEISRLIKEQSHSGILSPTVSDGKEAVEGDSFFAMVEHDWPMNDSCPVCLDEFNQNEVINELPCGHCFHIACIHPWLQYRSPCCPLCKLDVREEYKPQARSRSVEEEKTSEAGPSSRIGNLFHKLILKSSRSKSAELIVYLIF